MAKESLDTECQNIELLQDGYTEKILNNKIVSNYRPKSSAKRIARQECQQFLSPEQL